MSAPHIDAAAPDEAKIALLAETIYEALGAGPADYDTSARLAAECFKHGRQSGFRAAVNELRERLANNKTADTDALADDFLTYYGAGLHIENGKWRR